MIEDMLFPAGADDANGLSGRISIWLLQLEMEQSNEQQKTSIMASCNARIGSYS